MNLPNVTRLNLYLLPLVLGLTACATPQAARDSAKHTAAMVTQLEVQLAEFRRQQEFSAKYRLRALRKHEAEMVGAMASLSADARILEVIGATEHQAVARRLKALAEGVQANDEALRAELAELDTQIAALFKPLPDTAKSSAETAKALGAMSQEISSSVRLAEYKAVVEAVRKAVDDLDKKAKSPPSPSAPASAASAP